MRRMILAASLLLALSPGAYAQSSAVDAVVGQCAIVAANNGGSDAGRCVDTTAAFLRTIQGLPSDQRDTLIADLVTKLVPLAEQNAACNAIDDEIAKAIALAAPLGSTADQRGRITEVSASVASCDTRRTASIGVGRGGTPPGQGGTIPGSLASNGTAPGCVAKKAPSPNIC